MSGNATAETMLELLAQREEDRLDAEEAQEEAPVEDLRAKARKARMEKRNQRTGYTRRKAIEEAGGAIKMKDAKKRARSMQQQNIAEVWERLGLKADEYPEVRQEIQLAMNRNNQQQLQQIVGRLVTELMQKRQQQSEAEVEEFIAQGIQAQDASGPAPGN